jgi:hypothetical protein
MIFNIEADPGEMRTSPLKTAGLARAYMEAVGVYLASLRAHPNPPAANPTRWASPRIVEGC